jgi:microsomal dipeptidase-like Zn-dependent dipeptidase
VVAVEEKLRRCKLNRSRCYQYHSGIPFLPGFIEKEPSVDLIADHIEHISASAGKSRVGIGSDFDGFVGPPIPGMEDVSQYKSLVRLFYIS